MYVNNKLFNYLNICFDTENNNNNNNNNLRKKMEGKVTFKSAY